MVAGAAGRGGAAAAATAKTVQLEQQGVVVAAVADVKDRHTVENLALVYDNEARLHWEGGGCKGCGGGEVLDEGQVGRQRLFWPRCFSPWS